jgi:hypothetical protein
VLSITACILAPSDAYHKGIGWLSQPILEPTVLAAGQRVRGSTPCGCDPVAVSLVIKRMKAVHPNLSR